jgi:iron-sulfur cluster assembly accessory protein
LTTDAADRIFPYVNFAERRPALTPQCREKSQTMSTETATPTTPEPTTAAPEAISDPAMAGALALTDTAADKVREIRDAEAIEPHYSLRVKVMGGGCSGFQYDLYFDEHAEGDYVFESNGVKLISDQMSFMYLMGTSIDYVEGLQGAGFKFNNPNTTGSCGCGSSFSV